MINVTVNDICHQLESETTLQELLKRLGVQKEGTAVAINNAVIPRSKHADIKIVNGDKLEIIRAVGGG